MGYNEHFQDCRIRCLMKWYQLVVSAVLRDTQTGFSVLGNLVIMITHLAPEFSVTTVYAVATVSSRRNSNFIRSSVNTNAAVLTHHGLASRQSTKQTTPSS